MSTMFSSKSSGGGVVVVRLAMTDIVPSPTDVRARAARSADRETAVHADHLPGYVPAGRAGQQNRGAGEVRGQPVAADVRPGGVRGDTDRVGGHLGGQRG